MRGGMKQGIPWAGQPLLHTAVPSDSDEAEQVGTGTPIAGGTQPAAGMVLLCGRGSCLGGAGDGFAGAHAAAAAAATWEVCAACLEMAVCTAGMDTSICRH